MDTENYVECILSYGETDKAYLRWHAPRFLATQRLVDTRLNLAEPRRIFDVGAHWLHQAWLYAAGGHDVVATDVSDIFGVASVQALAADNGITLHHSSGFEREDAFADIDDDAFDIILFTETLEHITFNPVGLCRQLHRVLKPDGVIVITTPNYYAWDGRAWDLWRFLRGMGGGISVDSILKQMTYGHHWKEYSLREIVRYFQLLPVPLHVQHAEYLSFNTVHRERERRPGWRVFGWLEGPLPFLRDSIYAEVRASA